MDSISTAELLELALLARESVDNQFQYWITITFAVIVPLLGVLRTAVYVAGTAVALAFLNGGATSRGSSDE